MRLADLLTEGSRVVFPTRGFAVLYHVGSMDPSKKGSASHEGGGLSVSLHPQTWRRIARGQVSGDLFRLYKRGNRFLDFHSLKGAARAVITAWGIEKGYATPSTVYTVSYFDDELDDVVEISFTSKQEAEEELEVNGFGEGKVEEKHGGLLATPALCAREKQTRIDPGSVFDYLALAYTQDVLKLDGVWWQDRFAPEAYSAPRGVIFATKASEWAVEKISDEDGPDELDEAVDMAGLGYKQDNPGGRWLKDAQEDAEAASPRYKMLIGKVTAYLGTRKPIRYPVALLKKIPGSMGEDRKPGDGQYDRLMRQVELNGFDSEGNPVLVGINHKGEAYVLEGNTRIAVANALGIPMLDAEFRWFNGGEKVGGEFSPEEIARHAKPA